MELSNFVTLMLTVASYTQSKWIGGQSASCVCLHLPERNSHYSSYKRNLEARVLVKEDV